MLLFAGHLAIQSCAVGLTGGGTTRRFVPTTLSGVQESAAGCAHGVVFLPAGSSDLLSRNLSYSADGGMDFWVVHPET